MSEAQHIEPTSPAVQASVAISYVLDRACSDEALGRHLCPFTESWARLVAAEAALLGWDVDAHDHYRRLAWNGAPRAEIEVALAWRSFLAGRRSDVLTLERSFLAGRRSDVLTLEEGDATAPATVHRRLGAWAVITDSTGERRLVLGREGTWVVTAGLDDLLGHLMAIEAEGDDVLGGHDLAGLRRLLEGRGVVFT